ncbi:hypothetical protein V6N12_021968 [Hibiscus sabdariffa]|uniref:Cytochrome P450 n=1 Tax=Hibiscus sabdariffa TaxID=183260 RepID=A0ABR2FT98_9ROSI
MANFPWEFVSQSSWLPLNEGLLYSPLVLSLLILKFRQPSHRNSPPSPPKIPIIGNLHQLGRLPHRSLNSLSDEYGPLMLLKLGQVPTLVISSAEIVEEILKNHDIAFLDRPNMTAAKNMLYEGSDLFLSPYGSFADFFPHSGRLDVLTGHIGRLKAIFDEMDALLDSVIEERINSPENNMLDVDHGKKDIVQILLHLLQNTTIQSLR